MHHRSTGRWRTAFGVVVICGLLLAAAPAPLVAETGPLTETGTPEHAGSEAGFLQRINRWRLDWIADTDAWIHAGPAGGYVNLQDTRMSPVVYSGIGPGFHFAADLVRDRFLWPHTVTGRYVRPSASDVLAGDYESISGEANVALLYRFAGTGLSAGGSVAGAAHLRSYPKLQNNAFNSDVSVSLNASGRWEAGFTALSRGIVYHVRADLPLVAWVARTPAYAAHATAHYLAPPVRYVRLAIETGLTWTMRWSEDNTVRLRYAWDYYALDPFDGLYPLRIATHTLSLSLGTRIM